MSVICSKSPMRITATQAWLGTGTQCDALYHMPAVLCDMVVEYMDTQTMLAATMRFAALGNRGDLEALVARRGPLDLTIAGLWAIRHDRPECLCFCASRASQPIDLMRAAIHARRVLCCMALLRDVLVCDQDTAALLAESAIRVNCEPLVKLFLSMSGPEHALGIYHVAQRGASRVLLKNVILPRLVLVVCVRSSGRDLATLPLGMNLSVQDVLDQVRAKCQLEFAGRNFVLRHKRGLRSTTLRANTLLRQLFVASPSRKEAPHLVFQAQPI